MNKTWKEIAKLIRLTMIAKDISQKQLAEKIGTKQGSISLKLSKKDVNYSTVVNICNALEIELKDIL